MKKLKLHVMMYFKYKSTNSKTIGAFLSFYSMLQKTEHRVKLSDKVEISFHYEKNKMMSNIMLARGKKRKKNRRLNLFGKIAEDRFIHTLEG